MKRIFAAFLMCSLFACVEPLPSVDAGAAGGGTGRTGGGTATGGGGTATGGGTGTGGGVSDDVTAPELLDTTPTTGSTNVAAGQALRLIFSEPMEVSSVQVSASPAVTFNAITANTSGTLFTVEHERFSFDTGYSLTITGADLAGNALPPQTLTFRTEAAPDTTPPTIVRTLPASNSTGVAVTSPLVVTFSEPMDRDSVQLATTPVTAVAPLAFAVNDSEVTLTPLADLTPNTSYTLTVRGSDVSGNALAQQTITFTTEAPRDTTAPALTSSTPSSAQTNVATNTRLSLTFSEPVAEASLVVTLSPSAITLGEPTFSSSGRTATFTTPSADFTASRSYTVTVEADDLAGNALPPTSFTFTTASPPDTTRPTVAATSPTQGATDVPANSNLEFNFSEPMDEVATEAAFTTSPVLASRTITWNAAHTLMSVNPGVDLPASTNVTMTIGVGARDLTGNPLASARTVSFRTAAAPDTTKPTIVSVSPANGAVGVAPGATITVTFSEPMRQSAAQAAFQILAPSGFSGGLFSWNSTSTQMTYNPPDDFVQGTQVQFAITTAAEDLAGNTLAANATRTFRIKRVETKNFYAFGTTDSSTRDARAGYITTNGSCNSASVTPNSAAIAGDESQGFMTFSLAPLSSLSNVVIRTAVLNVEQVACHSLIGTGAPIDSPIMVSHVDYGPSLTLGDCNSPTLGSGTSTLTSAATAGRRIEIVSAEVRDDFANRVTRQSRSQWRLHTTRTGQNNICIFATQNSATNHPYLRITYEFD